MVKRLFNPRRWKTPKVDPAAWHRRGWDYTKRLERGLESIVGIGLRLGTLVLLVALFIFLYRTFTDQRYVIKSFSVPAHLEAGGFNGSVVATRINDEVARLKELAASVKADSLQLAGHLEPGLEVAVMGIGFSLESITYHLRQAVGRRNPLIRGEITRLDSAYTLTLRMTGFEPVRQQVSIRESGSEGAAVERLMRLGGEAVMLNADPYRLALVHHRERNYEAALAVIRHIIRERPQETHWAYHAWGAILETKGQYEAALERYRQAVRVQPGFDLSWRKQAFLLNQLGRTEEANTAFRQALTLQPDNKYFWISYGWMLHNQQRYLAADSAFQRATELAPDDSQMWMSWVDSRVSRQDLEGAEALLDKVDLKLSENVEGYLQRGLISLARGDTSAAIDHVMTAYQLDPDHEVAVKMALNGYYAIGDYENAVQIYERTNWLEIDEDQRQQSWNMAAMAYNMLDRHPAAFELSRRAIAVNPNRGYPYTTLAETFAFTGRYDSCYHYLALAFEKGFPPHQLPLDTPPYRHLSEHQAFQDLLARYRNLKD